MAVQGFFLGDGATRRHPAMEPQGGGSEGVPFPRRVQSGVCYRCPRWHMLQESDR